MRPFAWTIVLCREFGLPVVLSVGLHGVVGIALGSFALSTHMAPAQLEELSVDLVALEPELITPPPALKLAQPTRRQPVQQAAELAPSFRDIPRMLVPAAPPAAAFPETVAFSAPEPVESLASFTESVGGVPVSRPLPVASSGLSRLLRDTTAVAGSVRSKVRPGENPRPEYPRAAREAGWEGTVVLQVTVLQDGTAGSVTLHKTSGYAVLDEAALTTVKTWRFIPAMDGNFPLRSVVRLPIRFDLKGSS